MAQYVLEFELGVEADSQGHANEKRFELEKLIKAQFAEGELRYIDSDVGEEDDDDDEEEEEEEDLGAGAPAP